MGYTTDFRGCIEVKPAIKPEHRAYLEAFRQNRRMKRDAKIAETLPDPVRVAAGLPIGPEGAYFVGGTGFLGQNNDASITAHNSPPAGQPGLWCQWTVDQNGDIKWDGDEKFDNYVEWMQYIIENFLKPWGYTCNGGIEWRGDDWDDTGRIVVMDNKVSTEGR